MKGKKNRIFCKRGFFCDLAGKVRFARGGNLGGELNTQQKGNKNYLAGKEEKDFKRFWGGGGMGTVLHENGQEISEETRGGGCPIERKKCQTPRRRGKGKPKK